jgi:cell division protein FtsQ
LEKLPWVEHAAVMRLLPNQIRVSIVERVPIAFVKTGTTVRLIDATGALLTLSPSMIAAKHYSFPVVTGIQADDPPELRAARMHLYSQFISSLDSGGGNVSAKLSEVDLSDPEDIRAILPSSGSDILVHFGDSNFLNRYQRYQKHLDEWLRQYPKLASVDLRYENQIVLGMSKDGLSDPGTLTGAPSGPAAKSRTTAAVQGSMSDSSSHVKATKAAKASVDHHVANHHAAARPAAARRSARGEHRPAKKAAHGSGTRSKG